MTFMPEPQSLNLYPLCQELFRRYCQEHDLLDEEAKLAVGPDVFLAWLSNRANLWSLEQIAEILQTSGAEMPVWQTVAALCDDPLGANRLSALWQRVLLADRAAPNPPLFSAHHVVLLRWQDGKASLLSSYIDPSGLGEEESAITDGMVTMLLPVQSSYFADQIIKQGLDRLHQEHSLDLPEDAYCVFMGACLKTIEMLAPPYREAANTFVRLFQSFFGGPPQARRIREATLGTDETVAQRMQQHKRQRGGDEKSAPEIDIPGGFN